MITRRWARRTGERKQQVLRVHRAGGQARGRSIRRGQAAGAGSRAGALAAGAPRPSCGRSSSSRCSSMRAAAGRRADPASGCAASKITDRLVSIFDPDARPIRKGKLGKPNEFGYVAQICEVTENTQTRRARADHPRHHADREPGRGHAAARHGRRAGAAGDHAAGGRARRRLQRRPDHRGARAH